MAWYHFTLNNDLKVRSGLQKEGWIALSNLLDLPDFFVFFFSIFHISPSSVKHIIRSLDSDSVLHTSLCVKAACSITEGGNRTIQYLDWENKIHETFMWWNFLRPSVLNTMYIKNYDVNSQPNWEGKASFHYASGCAPVTARCSITDMQIKTIRLFISS